MNKPTYKLYQEELEEISYKPVGFMEKLISKATRKLTYNTELLYKFKIPVSEYLRAELFCEDVSEAADYTFTQHELIDIIFDDFMYQAKRRSNPFDLYQELNTRSLEQAIQIHKYSESITILGNKKVQMKEVHCRIRRKEALRLEVMLSDIADLDLEKTFTVTDVLKILYSDFILKYKKGELTNILEKMIKRLG